MKKEVLTPKVHQQRINGNSKSSVLSFAGFVLAASVVILISYKQGSSESSN